MSTASQQERTSAALAGIEDLNRIGMSIDGAKSHGLLQALMTGSRLDLLNFIREKNPGLSYAKVVDAMTSPELGEADYDLHLKAKNKRQ